MSTCAKALQRLLTASRRGETVARPERPRTHDQDPGGSVGIDDYETRRRPAAARAASTTSRSCARCSRQYFDVPNEDIRVVVNGRATKAAILHRLRDDDRAAREPGDVRRLLLLRPRVPGPRPQRRRADRRARRDHLPVRHGLGSRDLHPRRRSRRDLRTRCHRGVLLEAFFDCCFWGADARGLEPEPRPEVAASRRSLPAAAVRHRRARRGRRGRVWPSTSCAACRRFTRAQRRCGAPRRRGSPRPRTTSTAAPTASSPTGAAGSSPSTSSASIGSTTPACSCSRTCVGTCMPLGYVQTPELSAPGELRDRDARCCRSGAGAHGSRSAHASSGPRQLNVRRRGR